VEGGGRMKEEKKCLYAGSFDPVHYGHIDIIKRAAGVFDKVIVGLGTNPGKGYMFKLEERIEMARECLSDLDNVEVESFDGLLVDYAYDRDVDVIVKGVRNIQDLEYERVLEQAGLSQGIDIETMVLFAKPEMNHFSSTLVKAVQLEYGNTHKYVPSNVKQRLEEKMAKQYIVGITGEMGSGKSYISRKLEEFGQEKGIKVHHIEFDRLGHKVQEENKKLRKKIVKEFGEGILDDYGNIDRKSLGDIVFNDEEEMQKLNRIMFKPIMREYRRELRGRKGLILVDSALLAEFDIGYICNDNVIMVDVSRESQYRRIRNREMKRKGIELSDDKIGEMLRRQYTADRKREYFENKKYGKVWGIDNSSDDNDRDIEDLLEKLVKELGVRK